VQAGLIVGSSDLIARLKKNPIFRTIRVDKIAYAVLEKMLTLYLNGTYRSDIKLWSLLSVPTAELKRRGEWVLRQLGGPAAITVRETNAFVGGGALPESAIPSAALVFSPEFKPHQLDKKLRAFDPPVLGRIENDQFILDLKAVDREDLATLANAIKRVVK
jgi:L-seryl-tRNA(Ser) seleniumtransferase